MFDARGTAWIGPVPGQTETAVGLAQQRDAPIAGHVPAGEAGADRAFFLRLENGRIQGGKWCLSQRLVVYSFHPIDIGRKPSGRFF
jgi:hypothetical protein